MVDEVTEENGPLQVVAGTHCGPIHSHWHGGVFTGAVADEVADDERSHPPRLAWARRARCA